MKMIDENDSKHNGKQITHNIWCYWRPKSCIEIDSLDDDGHEYGMGSTRNNSLAYYLCCQFHVPAIHRVNNNPKFIQNFPLSYWNCCSKSIRTTISWDQWKRIVAVAMHAREFITFNPRYALANYMCSNIEHCDAFAYELCMLATSIVGLCAPVWMPWQQNDTGKCTLIKRWLGAIGRWMCAKLNQSIGLSDAKKNTSCAEKCFSVLSIYARSRNQTYTTAISLFGCHCWRWQQHRECKKCPGCRANAMRAHFDGGSRVARTFQIGSSQFWWLRAATTVFHHCRSIKMINECYGQNLCILWRRCCFAKHDAHPRSDTHKSIEQQRGAFFFSFLFCRKQFKKPITIDLHW